MIIMSASGFLTVLLDMMAVGESYTLNWMIEQNCNSALLLHYSFINGMCGVVEVRGSRLLIVINCIYSTLPSVVKIGYA